jgi:hypothetical protein
MAQEDNLGPNGEPLGPETDDNPGLTGELLWKIATGEEACEDEGLRRDARRYAALLLRRQGHGYREIGQALGCSLTWAWKLVTDEVKRAIREPAEATRQIHIDRLEAMLQPQLDRATDGDAFAVTAALQIMARIEYLLGIEPPKRPDGEGSLPMSFTFEIVEPKGNVRVTTAQA